MDKDNIKDDKVKDISVIASYNRNMKKERPITWEM
jgi:hypothetical protein